MRIIRRPSLAVATLLLAACGSSLTVDVGGSGSSSRAIPIAGRYAGSLSRTAVTTSIEFTLSRAGIATGWLRPKGATPIAVNGRFSEDRLLTLTAGAVVIEAVFTGAYYPQDVRVYDTRGVRCVGTWRSGEATGNLSAWWDAWPPALPPSYGDDIDWGDFDSGDDDDTGGDETGGDDTGGDSGTGPVDTGGGGTGDEVVLRRS